MSRAILWTAVLCLQLGLADGHAEETIDPGVDLYERVAQLEFQTRSLEKEGPTAATTPTDEGIAGNHVPAVAQHNNQVQVQCPSCPPPRSKQEERLPKIQVGGFLQADWAWLHQDTANAMTVGDVQDGADFRRARLDAHGDVWENVGYMIEFDFGFPGRPSFMDVYIDVRETRAGTFRFGQWRHPIGMDGLTSVKELTFLERALPFAFLPFR